MATLSRRVRWNVPLDQPLQPLHWRLDRMRPPVTLLPTVRGLILPTDDMPSVLLIKNVDRQRHGEDANFDDDARSMAMCGRPAYDTPLTDAGHAAAVAAAHALLNSKLKIDAVYSSQFLRSGVRVSASMSIRGSSSRSGRAAISRSTFSNVHRETKLASPRNARLRHAATPAELEKKNA